jgi:hypothetical protein
MKRLKACLELRLGRFGAGDRRDRQGDNNVRCVISGSVAGELSDRVRAIGSEQVKGISAPIAICESERCATRRCGHDRPTAQHFFIVGS